MVAQPQPKKVVHLAIVAPLLTANGLQLLGKCGKEAMVVNSVLEVVVATLVVGVGVHSLVSEVEVAVVPHMFTYLRLKIMS